MRVALVTDTMVIVTVGTVRVVTVTAVTVTVETVRVVTVTVTFTVESREEEKRVDPVTGLLEEVKIFHNHHDHQCTQHHNQQCLNDQPKPNNTI